MNEILPIGYIYRMDYLQTGILSNELFADRTFNLSNELFADKFLLGVLSGIDSFYRDVNNMDAISIGADYLRCCY